MSFMYDILCIFYVFLYVFLCIMYFCMYFYDLL